LNISLFNKNIHNSFLKILNNKEKTIELLNKFRKELINNKGDIPITIIGNRNDKNIISIIEKKQGNNIISNEEFIKNVYNIVDKYNLSIIDFYVDDIGQMYINTQLNDKHNFNIDLNGIKIKESETFFRGLHFSSKINDYRIIPTTIRIHCSNQITLNNIENSMNFNNMKMLSLKHIYDYLDNLKKNNFIPKKFIQQVQRSYNTPASLREFEYATNIILNNSTIDEKEINNYINYDEIKNTFNEYQQKNNITLKSTMKSQIPTNKTVWQLVNTLTYIASNSPSSEIEDHQRIKLMSESGRMLNGDTQNNVFDLQLMYTTPYTNMWKI